MLKMAVLLSGSGRTLDNFHQHIISGQLNAKIEVVLSNVENALGLEKAEKYGYPAFYVAGNGAANDIVARYDVDVVCLAGYLKLYRPPATLAQAVINIHPSLVPSFCGAGYYGHHVHDAVRKRGCLVSGCTVHFANENFDEGPIIYQQAVALDHEDESDRIAEKVFAAECEAYPRALQLVMEKGIDYFWNRVKQ